MQKAAEGQTKPSVRVHIEMFLILCIFYRDTCCDTYPGTVSDVAKCVREDFRQIGTVSSATAGSEEISKSS